MSEDDGFHMMDCLTATLEREGMITLENKENKVSLMRYLSEVKTEDTTTTVGMRPLSKDMWIIAEAEHRLQLLQHTMVGNLSLRP
jgi:hypothetical protein